MLKANLDKWQTVYNRLKKNTITQISFGISDNHKGIENLHRAYTESKKAIELSIFYDQNPIHRSVDFDITETDCFDCLQADWSSFELYVKNGIPTKADIFVQSYFESIRKTQHKNIDAIRMLAMQIVTHTIKVLNDMDIEIQDIFDEADQIYKGLSSNKTLNDIEKWIGSFLEKAITYVLSTSENKVHHLAQGAKQYIDENLSDSDLSLKLIANHLYANSSYLSRIFKQAYGVSMTGYIMKERIALSLKYLDDSNLKVYEIAEKVGISDAHYFSQCFKKPMGLSVKAYKNRKVK